MFQETQKFRQRWLLVLVLISTLFPIALLLFGLYSQLVLGKSFGNHPMSDQGLIIFTSFMLIILAGVLYLMLTSALYTIIDREGIHYKLTPFHRKFRMIPWNEIEKTEVIKYSPIGDYGGWGIRYGRKGKAFNVSGDKGLMITRKDGKNILIGTQKQQELEKFLGNMISSFRMQ